MDRVRLSRVAQVCIGQHQPFGAGTVKIHLNTGVLTAYPAPKDDATQAYPHAYHGTFLGFFLDEEQRYDELSTMS